MLNSFKEFKATAVHLGICLAYKHWWQSTTQFLLFSTSIPKNPSSLYVFISSSFTMLLLHKCHVKIETLNR